MSTSVRFPQKRLATVADRESPIAGTSFFSLALSDVESWTGKLHAKAHPEEIQQGNLFTPGTVLFGKLRPYLAKIWVSDRTGVYIGDFISVRPRYDIDPDFLSYVFRTEDFIHRATAESYGSKMPRIEWDRFKNLRVPLPPYSTQRKIVDFLDRETGEIDAFIADQERLTKLLDERRAATITHAVTKGLDPNVPVKNTKWGDVPEHWTVAKLGWSFSFLNGDRGDNYPSRDEFVLDGIPFINAGHLHDGKIDFSNMNYITHDKYDSIGGVKLRAGDILYCLRGSLGKNALIELAAGALASSLVAIRNQDENNIRTEYMFRLLNSELEIMQREIISSGSAQPNMSVEDLRAFCFPLPPVREQDKILEYLESEILEIDAAVGDAREAIALSRERRAALISAAVTGQLDVSQAQPPVGEVLEEEVRV